MSSTEPAPTGGIEPVSENADNSNTEIIHRPEYEDDAFNSSEKNKSHSSLGIVLRQILNTLNWVPPSCRYDPENPREFTLALNLLFGFAGTFTVANLYYSHPILDVLAKEFKVSQERASIIPTCAQGGYAAGLLFICPLGDLLKRRPMVLWLMFFTATMTLGLCLTKSFDAFVVLNFIMSVTTVTPQIMLPLVGTLAPPNRRATALSIVVSALMLGLLMARLLSGIIANYSSWRNVYWMSFALQYSILTLLWIWMPDYPQSNKNISYFRILFSILELLVKYPVLVQASLIAFLNSSCFTSFWTTLTFLLSGDPYNYSTVIIGLFALCGIGTMFFGPFFANKFIDRFPIHISVLLGICTSLIGIVIGTYTGKITIAGPILQAIIFDFGSQITQIANRTAIYGVAPKAANRVNTAFMIFSFCGQLMGTAVGNKLYARGGWIRSGSASVGFMGGSVIILLLRGPMETRWFGWRGGLGPNRRDIVAGKNGSDEEKQQQQQNSGVGQSDSEKTVVGDGDEIVRSRDSRLQSKEVIHLYNEEQEQKDDRTEIREEKDVEDR
ncbi:conserved hypothetical protein [Talaromyces stipitatus ATCC 10500]|uniref:Major facilitator superfamily (MFS) profile domain-containing protein n=1 Tax=Talaromyces stipitatus (strain ATCC 10500 / CBS 375.48 / QM 6759 / NRRL 1006) TaxID=441959 RepID=B8MFA4_TALSN|nr:uncharacterized protein TSTA_013090 [Talaromyces stipitatus ATCC 10500]EED16203.1 conserved hypothetical protein [Talaromyces stipitatus ATCC 10500]